MRRMRIRILLLGFCILVSSLDLSAQKMSRRKQKKADLAESFVSKARQFFTSQEYDSAIYYYQNASGIYEQLEMWVDQARCNLRISVTFLQFYEVDSSLKYAIKAYEIAELKFSNSVEEIEEKEKICFMLGNNYSLLKEYEEAIRYYEKGIELINRYKNNFKSLNIKLPVYLSYLGMVYEEMGLYDEAINNYLNSLELIELEYDSIQFFQYVNNHLLIGWIHYKQCDYDKALLNFKKALNIHYEDKCEDSVLLSGIYNSLGAVYFEKEDYATALNYFVKSSEIAKTKNMVINLVMAYNNIGDVMRKESKYSEALEYYNLAYNLYSDNLGAESLDISTVYNNIANVYKDIEAHDKAIYYYSKSISIRKDILGKKHFRISHSYQNLGDVNRKLGNYRKALNFYQEALVANIFDFEDNNIFTNPELNMLVISPIDFLETIILKAETFYLLYQKNPDSLKFLSAVINNYDLALDIGDKIRNDYSSSESKFYISNIIQSIYPNAINAVNELFLDKSNAYFDKVFEYIERRKCLVLYTSLIDSKAKKIAGIPANLIELETHLKNKKDFYLTMIQMNQDISDSLEIINYENQVFTLTNEYDSLINYYEKEFPDYYKLKYDVNISDLIDIHGILEDHEALVEYYLTDSVLIICLITRKTKKILNIGIDDQFEDIVVNYTKYIKLAEFKNYLSSSKYLYEKLVNPLLPFLTNIERLIIIPDYYLYYIPFETLIGDSYDIKDCYNFSQYDYLIKQFDILYNYSATLWANSRNEQFENFSNDYPDFIGFAPVFKNEKGYIVKDAESQTDTLKYHSAKQQTDDNRLEYKELPHSEQEVNDIVSLFIDNNRYAKGYFISEATENNFRLTSPNYKYIHVATHGYINDKYPELSGLLFYNSKTSSFSERGHYIVLEGTAPDLNYMHDDGILFTNEIYNLHLDADLIVLSACNTGVGKLIKGEGLMAMTRGFTYAGVNNIIFSIWKVSDKHTKELMISFYEELLNENDFSKSLKNAKLNMINDVSNAFPLFWAGFLLIGE